MSRTHNFNDSLKLSQRYADAPWWEEVYRKAFPNFATMHCVRKDGWSQRGGIDRVVLLESGKRLWIDEKVRESDWPDILVEIFSSLEHETPGWVRKDLACDYIAYAFIPSRTCYLLPFQQLRCAFEINKREWYLRAKKREAGYRLVDAKNEGYTTQSIAVPTRDLLAAINDAMLCYWQETAESYRVGA